MLTIAFVIGGGMATLVPAVGSHRSLEETRIAYYDRLWLRRRLRAGEAGPQAADRADCANPGRNRSRCAFAKLALLDFRASPPPASRQFASLPA